MVKACVQDVRATDSVVVLGITATSMSCSACTMTHDTVHLTQRLTQLPVVAC